MFSGHPAIGRKLLANIPRLEPIAKMIAGQHKSFRDFTPTAKDSPQHQIDLGSQILKVALEFDRLIQQGSLPQEAFSILIRKPREYNPMLVTTLEEFETYENNKGSKEIWIKDLRGGMILQQDILAKNGLVIASKGMEVTYPMLARVRNLAQGLGVEEPVRVLIPQGVSNQAGT